MYLLLLKHLHLIMYKTAIILIIALNLLSNVRNRSFSGKHFHVQEVLVKTSFSNRANTNLPTCHLMTSIANYYKSKDVLERGTYRGNKLWNYLMKVTEYCKSN